MTTASEPGSSPVLAGAGSASASPSPENESPAVPQGEPPVPRPKKPRRSGTRRKPGKPRRGCCAVIGAAVLLLLVVFVGAVLRDEFFPPKASTPTPTRIAPGAGPEAGEAVPASWSGEVEAVTLQGTVRLPAGSAPAPDDLSILSNDGQTRPAGDGSFSLPALRGPGFTTLALALNDSGNPVLLRATRGEATLLSSELSVESTVAALALFDMAVLELPLSTQEEAERWLTYTPGYDTLLSVVEAALIADAVQPLDDVAHPEVYEAAAQVTAEVLQRLESTEPEPQGSVGFLAVRRAAAAAPSSGGAAGYVFVTDDAGHNLPDVVLNNRTFAHYAVTVKGGKLGSSGAAPLLARRSKPYNIVRFQLPLPSVGTATTVRPGDGNLEFAFKKDSQLTAFDLSLTIISNLLGMPATQAGGIQEQLRVFMGASKEFQTAIRDLAALSRVQGLSPSDAAKEVGKFMAAHGTTIALTTLAVNGQIAADRAGELYVGKVAQILGRKAFFAITAGYAGVDTTGMAWSLSNAPDSYTEVGVQENGVYPAITLAIEPAAIENAVPGKGYGFAAKAGQIPDNVGQVRFLWDYTDGDTDEIESVPEAGMAMVAVKHAFDRDHEVRVYLIDMASGARLASAVAMVKMGAGPLPPAGPSLTPAAAAVPAEPAESNDPINGVWNAVLTCTGSSESDEIGTTVAGAMRFSAGDGSISLAADDGQGGWERYGTGTTFSRSGTHYSFEMIDAVHDPGGLIAMHHAYELDMITANQMTGRMHEEVRQNSDGGSRLVSEADYDVSFTR